MSLMGLVRSSQIAHAHLQGDHVSWVEAPLSRRTRYSVTVGSGTGSPISPAHNVCEQGTSRGSWPPRPGER